MRKATATYNAPEGDNKVVEMGGVTFFDGQSVELNTDEHDHMINKLKNNPHFDIEIGEEQASEKRRGRPPKNRDLKAGIEEARDHDFEADRRDNMAGRKDQAPAKGEGDQNPVGFTGTSPKPSQPAPEKASAE
jgi:hypothetical protein